MIRATGIKKGYVIRYEDQLWEVLDTQHTSFGKKGAYVQVKMKRLEDGHTETVRFSSDDEVEKAFLTTRRMQYLYDDPSGYVFMNPETGEQYILDEEQVEDVLPYLSYNSEVDVSFHEDRPIGIELPPKVTLEVTKTEPAVKGDTATGVTKPAELETGLTIKVPGHIKQGEKVTVDTRTGEFMGRA